MLNTLILLATYLPRVVGSDRYYVPLVPARIEDRYPLSQLGDGRKEGGNNELFRSSSPFN